MGPRYTKERAAWIYGQEMKPCPKCGSYNMGYQTPIVSDITGNESPREMLGKWARAIKDGKTPLQGPVFMWCRECFHKGPAVDCSGRTSEDVRQDPIVAAVIKRLWNEQAQEGA